MTQRIASCICGQLSARVDGEPVRVSVCHCLNCKRRSGSAFAVQARFPADRVQMSGEARTFDLTGDSGGVATFTFCPTCSGTVAFVNAGMEDLIAIPVGAFAEVDFPAPGVEVYAERKCGWVEVVGDMERWD
jgi:hypothetical protein